MQPPPEFNFFDASNVLVSFDYDRGFHQIAEITGNSFSPIKQFYTTEDIQSRLEDGGLS